MTIGDKLEDVVETMRTQRDEMRVRAHLMKAEIRDEWEELEERWQKLEPRLERLESGARESAGEIGAAARQLGEEFASAYRRMKDAIR